MKELTIDVAARPKQYTIQIGHNMLEQAAQDLATRVPASRYAVIADSRVAELHAEAVLTALSSAGIAAKLYTFPAGEEHKNRTVMNDLQDQLLDDRLGRDSCVIALGGGVTGDMAGFVAATYMRGIPFVQIPTTILAQVDSSIGGKTAIDTPQGKNLLGAFHHPAVIYMDMTLLSTLDERNYHGGLVELVKHGFIYDPSLLDFYLQHEEEILTRSGSDAYYAVMEELMQRNCFVKNEVVRQDDQEKGLRKILNYGHTFGHAVEILSEFRLSHGEAVAIGIRFAARLSVTMGLLSPDAAILQEEILDRLDMPRELNASITADALMQVMTMDKKARGGRPEFILLDRIGHVYGSDEGSFGTAVDPAILEQEIQKFTKS